MSGGNVNYCIGLDGPLGYSLARMEYLSSMPRALYGVIASLLIEFAISH